MKCPRCDKPINDGESYCPHCGYKLEKKKSVEVSVERQSVWKDIWKELRKNKVAMVSVVLLAILIIAVLLAVLLVLVIPALRELVIGNIIFNNRASLGVNEITSGRSEQFTLIFLANFPNAPFFGSGSTYIESLPLAALLSFGVVSALPLLIFAAVPLRTATLFKNGPGPKSYVMFLKAASIAFLINCLFEERAPFGPGITYFFLWFTSGFFIGCKKNLSVSIR